MTAFTLPELSLARSTVLAASCRTLFDMTLERLSPLTHDRPQAAPHRKGRRRLGRNQPFRSYSGRPTVGPMCELWS